MCFNASWTRFKVLKRMMAWTVASFCRFCLSFCMFVMCFLIKETACAMANGCRPSGIQSLRLIEPPLAVVIHRYRGMCCCNRWASMLGYESKFKLFHQGKFWLFASYSLLLIDSDNRDCFRLTGPRLWAFIHWVALIPWRMNPYEGW